MVEVITRHMLPFQILRKLPKFVYCTEVRIVENLASQNTFVSWKQKKKSGSGKSVECGGCSRAATSWLARYIFNHQQLTFKCVVVRKEPAVSCFPDVSSSLHPGGNGGFQFTFISLQFTLLDKFIAEEALISSFVKLTVAYRH